MHGSLEDGNVVEEANNTSEDTDGDGVIVVSRNEVDITKAERFVDICDDVGFHCELLLCVAAIDKDETCGFSGLEDNCTLDKSVESDGDSVHEDEDEDHGESDGEGGSDCDGDDEGNSKGEREGEREGDNEGEGDGNGKGALH